MTIEISNPATGRLVIAGVHDGACGIERDAGALVTVGFGWTRGARRPESAIGSAATLDGRAYRLVAARRSDVTQGFYVAALAAAD